MPIEQLYGDDLVLRILEKELLAVTKRAQKAKDECDAAMHAGSDIIKLRQEASQIVKRNLGSYTKENLAKIEVLAAREKKLLALAGKGLLKLMDAQMHAEFTRDELTRIIATMRWRQGLRNSNG